MLRPLQLLSLLALFISHDLKAATPNIILVMTDDQGYGAIAAHGHPWIQTPNLNRLHGESTRFSRFLVSPTCSPTRSAIMTGRHPLKNGVTHTIVERERMTLEATTLAEVLQSAGYTTGIFGKWHLGDEDPYQPGNRGFDEVFIHGAGGIGQKYKCSNADAPNNKYFDPVLRHNGRFVKTKGYCTNLFFDAALGWIHQVKDRPFFAYIVTNAPHGPFHAPASNTKRFTDRGFPTKEAGFHGMIENIDENMGRLLAKLKEWDLEENTVLIFMSDNGMTGGGSGNPRKPLGKQADGSPMRFYNAGMKGLKGSTDEGGVRVPFFIRWKGHFPADRDIPQIAAHIDILPTLAAIAGTELPAKQVEGRSLLPLLESSEAAWPDRFLFTHKARWPTGAEPDKFQWKGFAVRNQRYRLINGTALFDMEKDPGQKINIIKNHPELVKKMRDAYDVFWKEARPLMVNEDAPMSPTWPYHEAYYRQQKTSGIPDWQAPAL